MEKLAFQDIIYILSLLPNPILSFQENKTTCTILYPYKQKDINRIRVAPIHDGFYSGKEEVYYDNTKEIQFRLNVYERNLPFWEPINEISISKFDIQKENKAKDEGKWRISFDPKSI